MAEHIDKLRDILARLDAVKTVADMDVPGLRLHPLKGRARGFWAVTVRANWRVIFRFADPDASMSITWIITEKETEPCR
jgi:proteic killer suppression protein